MNPAENPIVVLVELLSDDVEIENWEDVQRALEYCEEKITHEQA